MRASASGSAPNVAPIAPAVERKPETTEVRTAAVSIVMPYAVWNGRLQHPDPVLRQFGQHYGVAFYRLMLQQNLSLSADCEQWEDRINSIDLRIRPGDDSSMAETLAKDARAAFRKLNDVHIINTWIIRCKWYGVSSIGKAGWRKDPETGLLAPFDLYNIDPWRWKFGPNFEPYLLTQKNLYAGEPIPPRSVMFARWGSNFTAYGESVLRDVYLSCWYVQTVTELLMHSIEVLGRPIPWIEVGDQLQGDDFDTFEAGIKADYKYYVITRTPNAQTQTTFPNATVLANGGAGASELAFIRYHDGLIQRKIFGTQQTQDKTSGSRAMETVRDAIAEDKTPPAAQMRDQVWTNGYLEDIGLVNYPNQPRQMWPVMDSDVDTGRERLTGPQIIAMLSVSDKLRMNQVTREWAVELLVRSEFDRTKAEMMVDSMLDPKSGLSKEPAVAPAPVHQPSGGPDAKDISHMRQIACEDGAVLGFDSRIPISTARGDVVWPLAQGDEITSIKRREIEEVARMAELTAEIAKS
jgi:hypothetical protein